MKTAKAKPLTARSRVYGANPGPWARVRGTVYGIRYEKRGRKRLRLAYIGKYAGSWKERIRQHLYGGGPWNCEPKPFADLVPGYDPRLAGPRPFNRRTIAAQLRVVDNVIARRGAFVVWQPTRLRWRNRGLTRQHSTCFAWYLKARESHSITWRRPAFNIAENLDNPRHVPPRKQEADRAKRDAGKSAWHENATGIRRLPNGRIERYGPGWRKVS